MKIMYEDVWIAGKTEKLVRKNGNCRTDTQCYNLTIKISEIEKTCN